MAAGGAGGTGGAGGRGGAGAHSGMPVDGAGGRGGAGGAGGAGGGGGGGAGGPTYAVYTADKGSGATLAQDTITSAGTPGAGGASGTPGAPAAPAGKGGAGHTCSGCHFSATIPVVLPAYAIVTGSHLVMEVACGDTCSGSGTILYLGAHGHTTPLAPLHFHLAHRGALEVHATLTRAAQRLLAHATRPIVRVRVALMRSRGGPVTYTGQMVITRTDPPRGRR